MNQPPLREHKSPINVFNKEEEKYRTILESIGQGYYEIDLKGKFIFFNEIMRQLINLPKEELLQKNYRDFLDTDNRKKLNHIFHKIYSTGHPNTGFVWVLTRMDGIKRQIGSSAFLMLDDHKNPIGFRGIARDISERKMLEDQLAQAQKLESIGQLAAGIAHEINTPMQFVGDNTHFLQDAFSDLSRLLHNYQTLLEAAKKNAVTPQLIMEIESLMDEIDLPFLQNEIPLSLKQSLDGLERTTNIVSAMKEFSHPGTTEKVAIDINKAIDSTITVARNEWKNVAEVHTQYDDSLSAVHCLPGEINQVILNIIINAAHAIKEALDDSGQVKGKISISTQNIEETWAEIRISDTGAGIPEQYRSRVFDPFFTTKEIGKGTGQGLAISHSVIVQKHNGHISFDTEAGKGTTFIIRLPIAPPPLAEDT